MRFDSSDWQEGSWCWGFGFWGWNGAKVKEVGLKARIYTNKKFV
jgi:hypothetical protein